MMRIGNNFFKESGRHMTTLAGETPDRAAGLSGNPELLAVRSTAVVQVAEWRAP